MPLLFDTENGSMDDLLLSSDGEPASIEKSGVYSAKVVRINALDILVSLGGKFEGLLKKTELPSPNIGDSFQIIVIGFNSNSGIFDVSKTLLEKIQNWNFIEEVYKEKLPIEGTVIKKIKDGYLVNVTSLYFVLPTEELGDLYEDVEPLNRYKRPYEPIKAIFKIQSLNKGKRTGVLFHKDVTSEQNKERWTSFVSNHKEGDIIPAIIKYHSTLGLFVEVESISCFIHAENLTWIRNKNIDFKKEYPVGKEVQVRILEINTQLSQIILGYKQTMENPWEVIAKKYRVGDILEASVSYLGEKYALLQIRDDVDGILNTSDLSWVRQVNHSRELLKLNQKIKVKIIGMNPRNSKILLGVKQMNEDPWISVHNTLQEGSAYKGRIISTKPFGCFVSIKNKFEGFIPLEEISWGILKKDWRKDFPVNLEVDFKINSINYQQKRVLCSLKQAHSNPLKSFISKHSPNTLISVKFFQIIPRKGLEVLVEDDLTAFIPIQAIPEKQLKLLQTQFKEGDELTLVFERLDTKRNKLFLSFQGKSFVAGKKEMNTYVSKEDDFQPNMQSPFLKLKEKLNLPKESS